MKLAEAYGALPLADALPFETFRTYCPTAHVARKVEGSRVFTTADTAHSFAFVVTGRVKLVLAREGPLDSIVSHAYEGDAVCLAMPTGGGRYCCVAVADAPTTRLLIIAREQWLSLVTHVQPARDAFHAAMAGRCATLCQRVSELSSGRVERRLAALLLRLAQPTGEHDDTGLVVPHRLQRKDLAELCATSVETTIRIMRRFEKRGLVRTQPWGFVIVDDEALRAISEGLASDPPPG